MKPDSVFLRSDSSPYLFASASIGEARSRLAFEACEDASGTESKFSEGLPLGVGARSNTPTRKCAQYHCEERCGRRFRDWFDRKSDGSGEAARCNGTHT